MKDEDFNPRSPSGLRLADGDKEVEEAVISIHAARVGCDNLPYHNYLACGEFQSTQPEWAATFALYTQGLERNISIHAARVGCDDGKKIDLDEAAAISIHAARVGCDKNHQ